MTQFFCRTSPSIQCWSCRLSVVWHPFVSAIRSSAVLLLSSFHYFPPTSAGCVRRCEDPVRIADRSEAFWFSIFRGIIRRSLAPLRVRVRRLTCSVLYCSPRHVPQRSVRSPDTAYGVRCVLPRGYCLEALHSIVSGQYGPSALHDQGILS